MYFKHLPPENTRKPETPEKALIYRLPPFSFPRNECFLLSTARLLQFLLHHQNVSELPQWGNSFLTLKVHQVTQPNLSFFSHSICILLLFLSSVFSSPPVLPHTLFHPAPSQQVPVSHHQTHFYFWSPPSFISVTIIVFQLVSLLQYFHHPNTVFLWQPESSFDNTTLISFFQA